MWNLGGRPISVCALLVAITVSACATGGRESADSFCLVAAPICLDPDDQLTEATEEQIIEHNEHGLDKCGWACKGDN